MLAKHALSQLSYGPVPEDECSFALAFAGATAQQPSFKKGLPSRSRGAAKAGGARRDRTDDLLLAKQALSQLSYGPSARKPEGGNQTRTVDATAAVACVRFDGSVYCFEVFLASDWWAWEDLNFRPHAYQARALTN